MVRAEFDAVVGVVLARRVRRHVVLDADVDLELDRHRACHVLCICRPLAY